MNKSVYIGISMVILIILVVIGGIILIKEDKKENNIIHNVQFQNELDNVKENKLENVQENKKMNEQENIMMENTVENKIENTISSETFQESPQTLEEKAVAIAKRDWGENTNIEFLVEGMNQNGYYIIAVRNSQTTEALAFYTVDVATETFTKKEKN